MSREDKVHSAITRRQFLASGAYGGLALALGLRATEAWGEEGEPFAAEDPVSRVVLVRRPEAVAEEGVVDEAVVQDMVSEAVRRFAGQEDAPAAWARFVNPEDTVGIKYTRGGPVITEPAVEKAVIEGVHTAGVPAERITSRDGGHNPADYTALINVPSVKVHAICGIAVSLKNYINFVSNCSQYHEESGRRLGSIWRQPEIEGKTRLIVVDMLRPYAAHGPQVEPQYRWNYCGILLATDPVAVDTVCLAICQNKRDQLQGEPWPIQPPARAIPAADKEYGLGTSDPTKIRLERFGWMEDALI